MSRDRETSYLFYELLFAIFIYSLNKPDVDSSSLFFTISAGFNFCCAASNYSAKLSYLLSKEIVTGLSCADRSYSYRDSSCFSVAANYGRGSCLLTVAIGGKPLAADAGAVGPLAGPR